MTFRPCAVCAASTPLRLPERWAAVLRTAYLVFNEGYAASSGADLIRQELVGEAIRLARAVADATAMALPLNGSQRRLLSR